MSHDDQMDGIRMRAARTADEFGTDDDPIVAFEALRQSLREEP